MNANERSVQWPSPLPYGKIFALVISLLVFYWQVRVWFHGADYLQTHLLVTYIWTEVHPEQGKYRVYTKGRGMEMAELGDRGPYTKRRLDVDPDKYREWLAAHVYAGQAAWELFVRPLVWFALSLTVLLWLGSKMDRIVNAEARRGRLIRGPSVRKKSWLSGWFKKPKGLYIDTD